MQIQTMPPKKRKLSQLTLAEMFAKKSNETEEESASGTDESKQHILIDLSMHQMANETGIDWTIRFNFDIHFIDPSSQQIDLERPIIAPMDTEEDDSDGEDSSGDDAMNVNVSDGQ